MNHELAKGETLTYSPPLKGMPLHKADRPLRDGHQTMGLRVRPELRLVVDSGHVCTGRG